MKRNSEWRKYARHYNEGTTTYWFHPTVPAQAIYVGDFLESRDAFEDNGKMAWRVYLFYILHGFLIDFEDAEDSMLSAYIADVDGMALGEAFDAHMKHPLLSYAMYEGVTGAYEATRDKSLQEFSTPLDVDSDADEEKVEKKEKKS